MQNYQKIFYLSLAGLFLLQVLYTGNSFSQIRYEELAESVRNPFWLQNGLVYDGISTNIGWYYPLLLIYKLFGFNLFSAKIFRLFLHLLFLTCLGLLLKKNLGYKNSLIPLFTIALSPTLLYYNTLQAQYGIDLQYLPIALYLTSRINFASASSYIYSFISGLTLIIASLSYPTFIFYLPGLIIYYFLIFKKTHAPLKSFFLNTALLITSVLLPLLLIFIFIQNKQLLIYDPVTKAGLFRGAGQLILDGKILYYNLNELTNNLFNTASGYYYEIPNVEFSHFLPVFGLGVTFYFAFVLLKLSNSRKLPQKKLIYIIFLTMFINLFVVSLTVDQTAGIRRYTPFLAAFYGLFTIIWSIYLKKDHQKIFSRKILIALMLVIPIHHLLVFIPNYYHLPAPSLYSYQAFAGKDPQKTLDELTDAVLKQDLNLSCVAGPKPYPDAQCRYPEIYAAVAGKCLWNKLKCHKILGFDIKSGKFINLEPDLWVSYYFDH